MPEKMRKEFDRSKLPMNDENDGEDNQGDRFIKQTNQNEELGKSPEDHALRAEMESGLEHENLQVNQKAVASAQKDVDEERAARRAVEKAAGWSPSLENNDEVDLVINKPVPATEGMRKSIWQSIKHFMVPRFEGSRKTEKKPKIKTEPFRAGKPQIKEEAVQIPEEIENKLADFYNNEQAERDQEYKNASGK